MNSTNAHPPVVAASRQSAVILAALFAAAVLVQAQITTSRADVLDEWNDAFLNANRAENTPPPLAARNLAMLHLAMFDAVNSIECTHRPYVRIIETQRPVSTETAAAAAGSRIAFALYPSQKAAFEALWQRQRGRAGPTIEFTNSLALGYTAADALLEKRATDAAPTTIAYIPSNKPGAWRRTPPFYRPPDLPQWGCLKPFALTNCGQFRPPPPPEIESARYAEDFNTVKRLGGRHSQERSAEETEIARFWSDFSGTLTPPGHWNQITRTIAANEKLTLAEKARLLALVNVALADAAVICWDAKFTYNFWRPVTAIHRADEDGNPATAPDPAWEPLLVTPAFPEHVSGHSTFGGAVGEILTRFFGRDDFAFSLPSDTLPGVVRHYKSVSAAVAEVGRSRIYGGIHFPSADEQGQAAGRSVGAWVHERCLPANRAAKL